MASPQPDQFTKVSSELLDAFCRLHLSGSEWSFVHAVLRKTYGYNKKEDWITNTQIMALTGLGKERVSEAKRSLIAKNIVTEKRNKISIQKDYEGWQELRKNVTKVTEKRNSELRKNVTTIDKIDNRHLSEQSSQTLKNKEKDMGWNKQSEDEELVIDADTGEVTNPILEKKKESKELAARKRELVDWLIKYQGRDPVRTSIPKQLKALNRIIEMRVTGAEAQQIIMEQMSNDFWRGKKEKPDFCTVVAIIEKRGE